jgi:hypothetical protein
MPLRNGECHWTFATSGSYAEHGAFGGCRHPALSGQRLTPRGWVLALAGWPQAPSGGQTLCWPPGSRGSPDQRKQLGVGGGVQQLVQIGDVGRDLLDRTNAVTPLGQLMTWPAPLSMV